MIESSECQGKHLLIKLLAVQNSDTLVAHPVSCHRGIFSKGEHSLEYIICFQYDLTGPNGDIGKGGNGEAKCVFTLLGWTNTNAPAARRLQYQLAGGLFNENTRLTKERCMQCLDRNEF